MKTKKKRKVYKCTMYCERVVSHTWYVRASSKRDAAKQLIARAKQFDWDEEIAYSELLDETLFPLVTLAPPGELSQTMEEELK